MPDIPACLKTSGDAVLRAGQKVVDQGMTTLRALQAEADKVGLAFTNDLANVSKIRYGPPATVAASLLARNEPQGPDAGTFEDMAKKEPGNYIFLFNTRSPADIDWSNPSSLARSNTWTGILKGVGAASAIGHAQIGWVCTDEHGRIITGGAGQSGQHGAEGAIASWEGWGLNVLNTVYLDGVLETEQDVLDRTKKADRQGIFSWIALKTDYATVKKMIDFVNAYAASGCAKNYGFPVDPLKFEGAGCTSFADAAFVKTGLDIPLFEASKRELNLPSKYLGVRMTPVPKTRPPELAHSPQEEKKVPIAQFIVGTTRWATESEPHQDFAFYDPELYYESAVSMENVYRGKVHMAPKAYMRTEQPDAAQARARAVSAEWMYDLLDKHVPVKMGQIHHTTGMIIDLSKTANCQAGKPAPRTASKKPAAHKAHR